MAKMYFVPRVIISTGGVQTQSIQRYDDEIQARKRFYSIVAGDIDKEDVLFEMVQVVRDNGLCIACEVIDNRGPEPLIEGD